MSRVEFDPTSVNYMSLKPRRLAGRTSQTTSFGLPVPGEIARHWPPHQSDGINHCYWTARHCEPLDKFVPTLSKSTTILRRAIP